MENDELGESRTTLRRTCGILGPCPLLREKPIIIFIIYKCTHNKRVKQPGKKGYTNLMSHLENVHKDSWEDEYRKSETKEQAVLPYPKVNKKAENIFRWLIWVILENREYSFVDEPLVRNNTKLEPICQKILQKYIDLVSLEVEGWL